MELETGGRAPFFSLIAVGSGETVSLREAAGRPLVLIFHGRGDEDAVREMNRAIREKFPDPGDPIIASVVDLSIVPPVYWVAANVELDRAYREAASELPEDADPKEYIKILADWTGSTTRKYRAGSAGGSSDAVVVIGRDSTVAGFRGSYDASGVLEILEKL